MRKLFFGFILGLMAWLLIDLPQTIERLAIITDLQMAMIDEIYQMRNIQPPAPDCDNDYLGPFEDWLNQREGGE